MWLWGGLLVPDPPNCWPHDPQISQTTLVPQFFGNDYTLILVGNSLGSFCIFSYIFTAVPLAKGSWLVCVSIADVSADANTSRKLLCAEWHIPSKLCLSNLLYLDYMAVTAMTCDGLGIE